MLECLSKAISPGDIYRIDPKACIDCGNCVEVCKYNAIVDYVEKPIEEQPIDPEFNS